MTIKTSSKPSITMNVSSVLIAMAMPALYSGRSVMAAFLVGAVICIIFLRERAECWDRAYRASWSLIGAIVLLITVSWLPNILTSDDPMRSFTTVIRSGLIVGLVCLLWSVIASAPHAHTLALKTLITTLAIVIAISLTGLTVQSEVYAIFRGLGWTEVNATRLLKGESSLSAILIPVIIWAGVRLGGFWRLCAPILVTGLILIIWLTASRSAVAGILGAIVVVCALVVVRRRNMTLSVGVVAIASTIVFGSLFGVLQSRAPENVPVEGLILPDNIVDWHRQKIWTYVWHAGEDNRWFGTGANAININRGDAEIYVGSGNKSLPTHPHNWIVEVVVETGYVGLATLVLGIAVFFGRMTRAFLRLGDPAVLAAIAVWTVYWTAGLFNFSYWSAWWQASFLLSTAICLAGRHDESLTAPENVRSNGPL